MTWTIMATYDGSKFIPDEPLPLEPGTRVVLTVRAVGDEQIGVQPSEAVSFFDTALSMDLDGPPDWSTRIVHYMYGSDYADQ
jgi:hypothetical protein